MTRIAPDSAVTDAPWRSGPTPCFVPSERPTAPAGSRIKVVQILATGGNGGAQESMFGLQSVHTYNSLASRNYARLIQRINGNLEDMAGRYFGWFDAPTCLEEPDLSSMNQVTVSPPVYNFDMTFHFTYAPKGEAGAPGAATGTGTGTTGTTTTTGTATKR